MQYDFFSGDVGDATEEVSEGFGSPVEQIAWSVADRRWMVTRRETSQYGGLGVGFVAKEARWRANCEVIVWLSLTLIWSGTV
jgi:hypothetical protein